MTSNNTTSEGAFSARGYFSVLTLSIFSLPTNTSKMIVLGALLFLVPTVHLVCVAWSTRLPIAAVYATTFLQSTMYILTATILLQIFVVFNVSGMKGPARPPPALMDFLRGPFGKYACLRAPSCGEDDLPLDRMQLKEDSPGCTASPTPEEDWSLVATALDRLRCVAMSIAMVAVHHL